MASEGPHGLHCPCLCAEGDRDWSKARWMPHLDEELRGIVVRSFAQKRFNRLGVLQAELRKKR
eukprot:4460912-Karenia_brevis.AAC.1